MDDRGCFDLYDGINKLAYSNNSIDAKAIYVENLTR